ncbi:hypothetical protein ASG31_05645 [Chryseobacterium sp. Leaf404]|uniref:hypothetical protein n=1 Tax=unclassified Chryseobacterium TaxID=2593645 RepID=UPI0006F8444A|nr:MULTISPECIES: hypothetical protein [unclassified Chryseobacterium]KQT18212.1 hypothetical protein ASG31_05645 [Chryseobacterium sp. Leaf404]
MIRKLKYHEIDFEKYNQCIHTSEQKNWYARIEILDHLSGSWEVLVLNDYEAVMPVHLQKKYGIKLVSMPLFCQQLGVFSKTDNPKTNDVFLNFLKKKFTVFLYSFNDKNQFSTQLQTRKNYKIPVSDYAFLRKKKYFKGRKSTVKVAQYLNFKECELNDETSEFIRRNYKGLLTKDFSKFEKYIFFLNQNKHIRLFGALKENELINLAIIIEDTCEFHLLALLNKEKNIADNGASFLVDKILEQHIGHTKFDFMGGNIRGIEVFFKSFGAELCDYPYLQNKFLTRLIR